MASFKGETCPIASVSVSLFLVGLCATLLLAACLLHGSEAHTLSCDPPAEGRYRMVGRAPNPLNDDGYIPFADSTVEMRLQFENLYVGMHPSC